MTAGYEPNSAYTVTTLDVIGSRFDVAIGKEVMEREIIEQHDHHGYRLRNKRPRMQQVAESKLDHKDEDAATKSGNGETHTTREP
jgi:hypothetical protein